MRMSAFLACIETTYFQVILWLRATVGFDTVNKIT